MKCFIIVCFLMNVFLISDKSQFLKDLSEIKNVYYNSSNQIGFNYKYRYFEDLDYNNILDSLQGTYIFNNGNYQLKTGKYSLYKNQKYLIRVNTADKNITILDPTHQISADVFSNLDSMFSLNDVTVKEITTKAKSSKCFRLSQPYGNMVDSIDFTFNRTTYLMEKIIVYIKYDPYSDNDMEDIKKPVLIGEFFNYKILPVSSSTRTLFLSPPYIDLVNGKIVLKEKYLNYTLSNHLN